MPIFDGKCTLDLRPESKRRPFIELVAFIPLRAVGVPYFNPSLAICTTEMLKNANSLPMILSKCLIVNKAIYEKKNVVPRSLIPPFLWALRQYTAKHVYTN